MLPQKSTPALKNEDAPAFSAGNYAAAASLYAAAVQRQPDDVAMRNNLAISLHHAGDSAAAIEHLQQALTLAPTHQRALLTLGFVTAATDDNETPVKALSEAKRIDPESRVGIEASRLLAKFAETRK